MSSAPPEARPSPPPIRAPKSRRRRVVESVARLVLGVALLVGLLYLLGPDWERVLAEMELDLGWLAAAFASTAAATYFTAARWQLLNERMTDTRLPLGTYFHYIAVTRFLGQFSSMLFMDFVGRGVGLKAAGSDQGIGRLLTPVLLERLLDLLLPAVLLVAVLVGHSSESVQATGAWLVGVVLVFGVLAVPTLQPMARFALRAYLWVRRFRGTVVELDPVQIPRRVAFFVVAHSLGRFGAVFLQFWAMGLAAGAAMRPLVVLSAMPLAQLSALVSITPGGLGIQDAGWAGSLRFLGERESTIALFLLAWHALTVVNFGVLSALTLPLAKGRRTGRSAPEP